MTLTGPYVPHNMPAKMLLTCPLKIPLILLLNWPQHASNMPQRLDRPIREMAGVVLDELAPKASGREALLDRKKAAGAANHSFAQAKDDMRVGY